MGWPRLGGPIMPYLDDQGNELKTYLDENGNPISKPLIPSDAQISPPLTLRQKLVNLGRTLAPSLEKTADIGIPTVGATIGGVLGAPAGPLGIGAGAFLGGAGGQKIVDVINQLVSGEKPPSLGQATIDTLKSGALGTLQELGPARSAIGPVTPKPLTSVLQPEEQAAVKATAAAGGPVDKSQATGSYFWEGAKAVSKRMWPVSNKAEAFDAAQKSWLRSRGEQLAERVAPGATGGKVATGMKLSQGTESDIQGISDLARSKFNELARKAAGSQVEMGEFGPQVDEFGNLGPSALTSHQNLSAPVSYKALKAKFAPVLVNELKGMPEAQQAMSPGLTTIKNIMSRPDDVDLGTALKDLSAVSGISRKGEILSGVGEKATRLASEAAESMFPEIEKSVKGLGPEAEKAWVVGREATKVKHNLLEFFDSLSSEPVATVNQMLKRDDLGINFIKQVKSWAPARLPEVGKAGLESAMDKVFSGGAFKAQTGFNWWQGMGDETKRELYGPVMTNKLDNFFNMLRIAGKEANPSGSGIVMALKAMISNIVQHPSRGAGELAGYATLGKLLYSPRVVDALNQTARMPVGSGAYSQSIIRLIGIANRELASDQNQ